MNQTLTTLGTATVLAVFSMFCTSNAQAEEARFRLAPTLANLNDLGAEGLWGVGGQVGVEWAFSDYWAVIGDAGASYHFEDAERELSAQVVSAAALGLRYNIDVFTYVPWVSVSAVGYHNAPLLEGAESAVAAGARVSFGVDYRIDRHWAIGVFADLHAPFSDLQRYPIYSNVGVNAAWIIRI